MSSDNQKAEDLNQIIREHIMNHENVWPEHGIDCLECLRWELREFAPNDYTLYIARMERIAELQRARAVLCTLAEMDVAIARINTELSILEVA